MAALACGVLGVYTPRKMLISFSAIAEVMAKGIPLGIHAYELYSVLWCVNFGEFSDVSEPPKDCSNKVYLGFP